MTLPGPLTQLGRYQLKSVLGRGAMGMVYEALDPRLGRKVAVKTILKSHMVDDATGREYSARFEREAQAAARLNHPHIVTVFDFGEQEEVAYIVMEFIEGRELAQHFEAKQFFDLPTAVRIMCELLDALAYAHERGIVHRDIKPANVMIDQQGRVKLTDFGVARLVESNADRTMPGTMVGTPSYMSPEQILGQAVGSRADIFAAGVILYQFLVHERPFTGNGALVLHRKIISEEPAPPSTRNSSAPKVFDAIVQRALAKNPDHRFESAIAFAAELKRALATLPQAGSGPAPKVDNEITVLMPPKPRSSGSKPEGTMAPPPGTSSTWTSLPPAAPGTPASPARRSSADTLNDAVRSALTMPSAAASGTWARPQTPVPPPPAASPPPRARQPMPEIAASNKPPDEKGPSWFWFIGLGAVGAAAAAGLWWWPAHQPASPPASPPIRASAPGTPASRAVVPQPAASVSEAAPAPAPVSMTPVPAAAATPVAVTALSLPSETAPALAPATSKLATEAVTTAPRTDRGSQASVSNRASSARCADLMQRLQLGEDLSPDKLAIFQKECKR